MHQHLINCYNKRTEFGDAYCIQYIQPDGWSNDATICDVSVTASAGGDRDQTGLGCSAPATATSEQETGGRTPDSEGSRN